MSKKIKNLPINLFKKAQREERNANPNYKLYIKARRKKREKIAAMKLLTKPVDTITRLQAETELELEKLLAETALLSDIPCDCSTDELLGEIALANDCATTIYIKRDGLSTLTIVLPQENPTIAQLKKAIESIARVQLQRELRQRYEERLKRRQANKLSIKSTEQKRSQHQRHGEQERNIEENDNQQQLELERKMLSSQAVINTGELVSSAASNGQHNRTHRSTVTWRYLWRAFALFHIEEKRPINDSDGNKLLIDCGIKNATILKFCKRENYFGRKRQ